MLPRPCELCSQSRLCSVCRILIFRRRGRPWEVLFWYVFHPKRYPVCDFRLQGPLSFRARGLVAVGNGCNIGD